MRAYIGASWGVIATVLAIVAIAAPASQAASFTSKAGETIKGESAVVFEFEGLKVNCNGVLSGTASAAVMESITFAASFSECTAFGFLNAKVTGFGAGECDFVVHASGTIDLVCAAGKQVSIEAGPCTMTMEHGTGSSKELLVTNVTMSSVVFDWHRTGLKYEMHDGFLCPAQTSTQTKSDGTEIWDAPVMSALGTAILSWDP